nr:AraC family transcriptional regulator [Rhodococcus sp. B10]
MTGTARVTVDDTSYDVPAGTSVRIPAGRRVSMNTAAGTVAFPILLPRADPATEPTVVTQAVVPPEWDDGLVHEFALNLRYLRGDASARSNLAGSVPPGTSTLPPLPRSAESFDVAQAILRDPGSRRSPAEFADFAGISVRTMQRRFAHETGLSFTQWRTRARIAAAIGHLADGRSVGWIANEVGFSTVSGFTTAFTAHMGVSPRRYRAAPIPNVELLSAPTLPAGSTWPRVNGAHVAVWMYRGCGTARIGERVVPLDEGQAVILPAGVRNTIDVDEGSLLLPVGFRSPQDVSTTGGHVHFTRADEPYLLHRVVSTYTTLRPRVFDSASLFDWMASTSDTGAPTTSLAARLAATIARHPADTRTLAEWASTLGVDERRLRTEFRTETGSTYPRWRALSRMTHARNQLHLGVAPSVVARRLGYAHMSAFTRAFTTAHGISPRDFGRLRHVHRNT